MKKIVKRLIQFMSTDLFNFCLKYIYRWQLKKKLFKNKKSIDTNYKKEIKNYWDSFNKRIITDWHNWYSSVNGIKDVRYIPEDVFYSKILPHFNRLDLGYAYGDKALYSHWFPEVKLPITIAKNMSGICYEDNFQPITFEDVLSKCENQSRVIIKATIDSGGGRNIHVINANSSKEMREKVEDILFYLKKDYVIQEIVEQHELLKKLNPTSLNTIRITSLLHNNQVSILTSHLRIGNENSFSDHGGIVCGINNDGQLQDFAIKYKHGDILTEHPNGFKFSSVIIPGFEKIREITKKEHMKFGHFRLVSWDFAIDVNGDPILIEFNLRYQGLNHHQLTIGPIFGDLTDEVLTEVFGGKENEVTILS